MQILLVDDHVLFREGLANLIDYEPDMTVVGEAGSIEEAIQKTIELKPDLILMDVVLPDGSGLEATRMILAERPETTVVVLTGYDSDELLFKAISAGAKGFLLKYIPVEKLLASLRAITRGEAAISRKMTYRVLCEFSRLSKFKEAVSPELEKLTPRERDVLRVLAKGSSNREIADQLYIAKNTVKIHVHNILDKMKFENRQEAMRFARRVVSPESLKDP